MRVYATQADSDRLWAVHVNDTASERGINTHDETKVLDPKLSDCVPYLIYSVALRKALASLTGNNNCLSEESLPVPVCYKEVWMAGQPIDAGVQIDLAT
ncbi:MAG: hypothetical protein ACUVX9_15420 [Anaerolineae bacterium]